MVRLNPIIHVNDLKMVHIYHSPEYKQKYNNLHGTLHVFCLLLKYLVQYHFKESHRKDHNREKLVGKKRTPTKTVEHVQRDLGVFLYSFYTTFCLVGMQIQIAFRIKTPQFILFI